jgi:hypothetical protein
VEAIILAGDVEARDVIVLPGDRDAVLVKQVRLGQGGFILTVVPVDDDRPDAQRLVTLTAGIRLRKMSPESRQTDLWTAAPQTGQDP